LILDPGEKAGHDPTFEKLKTRNDAVDVA
jgi:hypothetical protein